MKLDGCARVMKHEWMLPTLFPTSLKSSLVSYSLGCSTHSPSTIYQRNTGETQ